ncbi:MAG: preprotein translocase subunit SecE [Candidatus Paceibacterota bacterium]
MSKIREYLKESKAEIAHVKWPSKKDTIIVTVLVIVISVSVAYLLGLLDSVFTIGLEKLLP